MEYKDIVSGYDEALELHTDIYPLECIYLSCYAYIDEVYFYIYANESKGETPKAVTVALKHREPGAGKPGGAIAGFENELIRQTLRHRMAKQGREIRKHIIGRAIMSSLPVEEEEVSGV